MNDKRLFLLLLTAVLALGCLSPLFAPAKAETASLVRITKPADGTTVTPGTVELWTSFVYTGDSASELAAKLSPMTVQVLRDGQVLSEKSVSLVNSTVVFTDEGACYVTVSLPAEGVYTIRASVPGSSGVWSSVTVTAAVSPQSSYYALPYPSAPEGLNYDPGEYEQWNYFGDGSLGFPSGGGYAKYGNDNKGLYFVEVEPTEVVLDLSGNKIVRFNYKLTYPEDAKYVYYADPCEDRRKAIIKYTGGGGSTDEGYNEYTAVGVGTTYLHGCILVNGTWYDNHTIRVTVVDSSQDPDPEDMDAVTLTLPADLTEIQESAFAGDASLWKVVLPGSCKTIGGKAFSGCSHLRYAVIPASVTSIAADAFSGCPLKTIYGKTGSAAETYAASHNIQFVAQ